MPHKSNAESCEKDYFDSWFEYKAFIFRKNIFKLTISLIYSQNIQLIFLDLRIILTIVVLNPSFILLRLYKFTEYKFVYFTRLFNNFIPSIGIKLEPIFDKMIKFQLNK